MNRLIPAAIVALALAGSAAAQAAGTCTVIVNGHPLDPGAAACDDGQNVLLSAQALNECLGISVVPPEGGAPWTVRGFGHTILVRAGATAYSVDGLMQSAQVAPELRDDTLFVPLAMVEGTFELRSTVQRDGEATVWALSGPGSSVLDIREGRHEDRVRIVLDVERPTGVRWTLQDGLLTLELPASPGSQMASAVRLVRPEDELVEQIRQGPTGSGSTRIEIVHRSPAPPEVFSLPDPPRIVVDLLRSAEPAAPEPPLQPVRPLPAAAGVLESRNFTTPRGPVRVHVMDVDPRCTAIEVRPALAAGALNGRAPLTQIVRQSGAWGGVNGGYFAQNGAPLGMLVINGEWVRDPYDGRTVLGITQDGKLLMDRLSFDARVTFAGHGWQQLSAINRGHEETDTLVLFNRHWGSTVEGAAGRTRLVVDASGVVTAKICDGMSAAIPPRGFVLSGIGRMAASLDLVEVGCAVTVDLATTPRWPALAQAIGGGPRLVKDGQKHITASPERFRPDVYAGVAPRTAIGITAAGRLLLVVVDGNGQRCGMTLDELASTMIKLGARDAMNLDGGGSTTFVADGRLINGPSDGAERRVANALLIYITDRLAADGG
ncbi:MAG TPA: hypothetical protein DEP45_15510 [Armatimonadetes bacterium]|nr:hypothetical protein [Armatimonadota bacterium]